MLTPSAVLRVVSHGGFVGWSGTVGAADRWVVAPE
jgi:hypothetical protein